MEDEPETLEFRDERQRSAGAGVGAPGDDLDRSEADELEC
jgi:hypothetical protein